MEILIQLCRQVGWGAPTAEGKPDARRQANLAMPDLLLLHTLGLDYPDTPADQEAPVRRVTTCDYCVPDCHAKIRICQHSGDEVRDCPKAAK